MARMINADDLYEAMNQVGAFEVLKDKRKELFTSAWGVPIVEAEPIKHGRWGENIYGYRKCSVCGRVTQVDECMREPLYLYCPYCGSKMDEVEE